MKPTFFSRWAVPLLMLTCFLCPFAFRGATLAVGRMKNSVKDWLPVTFRETAEMDWFWAHFPGERFVIVSWDGCTGEPDDARFAAFMKRLQPPTPPSVLALRREAAGPSGAAVPEDGAAPSGGDGGVQETATTGARQLARDYAFVGDDLRLFAGDDLYLNAGGRQEKWLRGKGQSWYFLTPEGKLYRWSDGEKPLADVLKAGWRRATGAEVTGDLAAELDPRDAAWAYEDPSRLDAQLFASVLTGPALRERLTDPNGKVKLDDEEARRRMSGVLLGRDGKQTCLLLTLTPAGLEDFHRAIGRGALGKPRGRVFQIGELIGGDLGDPRLALSYQDLKLGGPPVDNVAIDEEGALTLVRLSWLAGLLGAGLSLFCLRSLKLTMMVFFVGGLNALAALSLVWWTGSSVDAVMMSMPALVYVLGLSGSVHLINHYLEARREGKLETASQLAFNHGWLPCTLCAITTALGMVSLYSSEIAPIRNFGLFSALGVVVGLVVLFIFLPSALQVFPPRVRTPEEEAALEARIARGDWRARLRRFAGISAVNHEEDRPGLMDRFWTAWGSFLVQHRLAVGVLAVAAFAFFGYGLTKIKTSVQMLKMFTNEAKIIHDYTWLEEKLGELVPMEVVVKTPQRLLYDPAAPDAPDAPYQLKLLERMELAARIQEVVEQEFGPEGQGVAGRTMSAATFAPVLPPQTKGAFAERSATNLRLEAHRQSFLDSEYVELDHQDGSELWRVSIRLAALKNVDYGEFVGQVERVIEPVMAAERKREELLRQLSAARDGRATGANVIVVADVSKPEEGGAPAAPAPGEVRPIDTQRIFAVSLTRRLRVASVGVDVGPPPAPTEDAAAEYAADLAKADMVVLVDPLDPAVEEWIRAQARVVHDARPDAALAGTRPEKADSDVTAIYTGVIPLVYKAQRTLLDNLIESTIYSFSMVAVCMIVLLLPTSRDRIWESFKPMALFRASCAGVLSMIPNVFPLVMVFGAMGWLGIEVDIGTMMTSSVAMGIAVDDTIHYLTWYRDGLKRGLDRRNAVMWAFRRCGTSMVQTAIIGGLGMFIFAASTFTPTQRFGVMMLVLIWTALIGDLLVAPSIYSGFLGWAFELPGAGRGPRGGSSGDEHGGEDGPPGAAVAPQADAESDGPAAAPSGNGEPQPSGAVAGPHLRVSNVAAPAVRRPH